jgi:predicted Zn-dependent protease with MMP-like domain
MSTASTEVNFDKIVEWAYSTLPQKVRDLPDFPGIQVVDEPPQDVLKRIRERRNWPKDRELLGLYSGFHRNQPQQQRTRISPELIFVFRGPILRCSRGNLSGEVKQVVWHEVAHWIGHDEGEVEALGLSRAFEDTPCEMPEGGASQLNATVALREGMNEDDEAEWQPRCIKCYSADVVCRELDKPLMYAGANLFDPIFVHVRNYRCNSCGYEWDDEDAGVDISGASEPRS